MEAAVLGLGILGAAVARRLASEGFLVTVWSRSEDSRNELVQDGLQAAASASEAIAKAPLTLLLLPDYSAIHDCVLEEPAASALQGKTVVQMGTIGASQSRHVARRVRELGGRYLEAPVQGSQGEAARGTLQIMLGAASEDAPSPGSTLDKALGALGSQRVLVGPVGSATALKLCMNHILAAETAAFAASMHLATRSGVPVGTFMDVLRGSALFAQQYEKKLPNMLEHRYDNANFHLRHMLKDTSLFETEAAAAGINTDGVHGIVRIIKAAMEAGHERSDYSSLYESVQERRLEDVEEEWSPTVSSTEKANLVGP